MFAKKGKGGWGNRSSKRAYSGRKKVYSSGTINTTAKTVAIGAGVGVVATVVPAIVPIYKAYTIAKIGKGIYDAYEKSKNKEKVFDKIMSESVKQGTSNASEKISENKASQMAKGIRSVAESAGLISQISRETEIEEDTYGTMLEGSVKNGMLSGIGNIASYTVEGLVG
ncbi:MAG: hypothetical protein KAU95_01690 [Candidatus Aenigmarchaeota archaeon]|nr:hypothetical protein [Candidatus Aenigmarchaeota archaeon]